VVRGANKSFDRLPVLDAPPAAGTGQSPVNSRAIRRATDYRASLDIMAVIIGQLEQG
jgi:hypothetical protein